MWYGQPTVLNLDDEDDTSQILNFVFANLLCCLACSKLAIAAVGAPFFKTCLFLCCCLYLSWRYRLLLAYIFASSSKFFQPTIIHTGSSPYHHCWLFWHPLLFFLPTLSRCIYHVHTHGGNMLEPARCRACNPTGDHLLPQCTRLHGRFEWSVWPDRGS